MSREISARVWMGRWSSPEGCRNPREKADAPCDTVAHTAETDDCQRCSLTREGEVQQDTDTILALSL